jgi:hypothetical protein
MRGRAPARDSKQPYQRRSADRGCDAAQKDQEPLASLGRGVPSHGAASAVGLPAVGVGAQRPQSRVHSDVHRSGSLLCESSNALDGVASVR